MMKANLNLDIFILIPLSLTRDLPRFMFFHICDKNYIEQSHRIVIMSNEEDRLTTISIKVSTRERLKKEGIKGDSYDDIILRLIDKAKGKPSDNP